MRAVWRPSQRARTDAGLSAGRRAPHQGPIEGRRAPRRLKRLFVTRLRVHGDEGYGLHASASYLIERVASFARARRRQPNDVLPVSKPEMQPTAAQEDPEEPLAARAAPLALFVVPPPHATPPWASGDTWRARCARSPRPPATATCTAPRGQVRYEPERSWHRVLHHSRTTTP